MLKQTQRQKEKELGLKQKYYCVNCKALLSKKKYKRCHSCNMKFQWRKDNSPLVAALNRNFKQRTSKVQDEFEEKLFTYGFLKNMRLGNYVVDYLNKYKKLAIEINGDYWHCNPNTWKGTDIHPHLKIPAVQIWEKDRNRRKEIESQGYEFIVIWESEIKEGQDLFDKLKKYNLVQNLVDKYKGKSTEEIVADLEKNKIGFSVLIENWQHNYNIGSCIRNANGFGANTLYYVGNKKIDTRGAVGTNHWMDVQHLPDLEAVKELKKKYTFVALDNYVGKTVNMMDFEWPENALMILGNESNGITPELLELADHIVEIPQYGSVRSLNAATASGIAMYDLANKRR